MPFHLTPPHVDGTLIETLEELLAEARQGNLIGLAYSAMYRGRTYAVNAVGLARNSPVFSRGTVTVLDDHLRAIIDGKTY
ncbi:MAG: hypothetical protein ACRCV9_14475 [Burkholderiaceae bacterium]